MPFNPETKYPSDIIMAEDWNEAMEEIMALGKKKLSIAGGVLKGALKIEKPASSESNVSLHITGTDGVTLPSGTKVERPIDIEQGTLRFNTDDKAMEVFDGTKWMSIMPVGTILPFGGEVVPNGWLTCDGKLLETEEYPALAQVLNHAWGKYGTKFRLPDLRGMFLRGWDQGAGNDPESKDRTKKQGGTGGDHVGSFQADQLKSHDHHSRGDSFFVSQPKGSAELKTGLQSGGYFSDSKRSGIQRHAETASDGGKETRPKNAYVHFIIKY